MAALRTLSVIVPALVAVALVPSVGKASAHAVDEAAVDVVLAIDGTASMRTSIAKAKQDGERLVAGLRDVSPDVRVGVVVFRDFRNPAGEYELLQPLTDDVSAVGTALERVRAVSNPDPANGVAESYSLLFHKSYSDVGLGWRSGVRKVLVVIGDAEPYGAGEHGLAGCRSGRPDPHGLSAAHELAQMRANHIVLLMVRQVSSETTATLGCYESLAERAEVGGAARNSGAGGALVEPIVSLMKQSFAPMRLRVRREDGLARYTLTLTNTSLVPMKVNWLRVRLPRKLRYEGAFTAQPKLRRTSRYLFLVWHVHRSVAPGKAVTFRFYTRPAARGSYRITANGLATLNNGLIVAPTTRAPELVVR